MGMLLEGEALQFFVGNDLGGDACRSLPVGCGKDAMGRETLQKVAHHLGTFSHKETLATAVFLLLELSDEFQLVFTNHFQKSR